MGAQVADSKQVFNRPVISMPQGANIPKQYIVEASLEHYKIIVPSRSTPNKFYHIIMKLDTRQLLCDCAGFQYRGDCAHIRGLIFMCYKRKAKQKGVSDTSLEAFFSLTPDALGQRQRTVYELLAKNKPMSNKEIAEILHWPINTITPRVKELRDMGLVVEYGVQKCPKTGRSEILWGV